MNILLAYLAGYTDGDGCFHIRQLTERKFTASFIISSTNQSVLNFFVEHFGGKVRFVRQVGSHKPQYHFIKNGKEAYAFVKQFTNLLIEKRKESDIFLWFFECNNRQEKILLIKDMKEMRLQELAKPEDKIDLERISFSINPTEMDFAYLAGFIDAECSIGLQRYKVGNSLTWHFKAILQCNNTRSQTLRWAISRFGGRIHFIKRKKHGINHKDQLTWRLSSKSLSDILPRIFPYLQTKKPVCEQLIKFSKTILSLENNPSRHSPKFKEFYLPIYREREIIFDTIRHLNHKGI